MKKTKIIGNYVYFAPTNFDWGDSPEGWEENYQFRIKLHTSEQEIKIEDTCNRMIPMCYEDIKAFRKALKKAEEIVNG